MSEATQIDASGAEPTGTHLRADAARNRTRIVEAARELFSERGLDVPMTAIARRAGIGAATLFRRFPDRGALIAEVFSTQIDRCEAVVAQAAADPDPWRGFCRFIDVVCRMQIEDRGFAEALLASPEIDDNAADAKRRDAEAAFTLLIDRAKESGKLRTDFSPSDLTMVLLANGGLVAAPREDARALSRRLVAYLLFAFGTEAARDERPLPPASRMGIDRLFPSTDHG